MFIEDEFCTNIPFADENPTDADVTCAVARVSTVLSRIYNLEIPVNSKITDVAGRNIALLMKLLYEIDRCDSPFSHGIRCEMEEHMEDLTPGHIALALAKRRAEYDAAQDDDFGEENLYLRGLKVLSLQKVQKLTGS